MNFVLHVHCFHYIDCLRIVRSLNDFEHATVKSDSVDHGITS